MVKFKESEANEVRKRRTYISFMINFVIPEYTSTCFIRSLSCQLPTRIQCKCQVEHPCQFPLHIVYWTFYLTTTLVSEYECVRVALKECKRKNSLLFSFVLLQIRKETWIIFCLENMLHYCFEGSARIQTFYVILWSVATGVRLTAELLVLKELSARLDAILEAWKA